MKKDLYPPEIEKALTEVYENPANKVLDRLRGFQLPTDAERATLVQYFLLIRERTPSRKEESIVNIEKMIQEQLGNWESEKEAALKEHPEKGSIINANFDRIRQILTSRQEFKRDLWLKTLVELNFPAAINALLMMNWYYIIDAKIDRFITSDAPFFFTSGIGLNKPNSEVFFPISTRIVIWLNWYSLKTQMIESTQAMTNEINKRLVWNASRYIFFSKEQEWLKKYCKIGKPDLRTLDLHNLMRI